MALEGKLKNVSLNLIKRVYTHMAMMSIAVKDTASLVLQLTFPASKFDSVNRALANSVTLSTEQEAGTQIPLEKLK